MTFYSSARLFERIQFVNIFFHHKILENTRHNLEVDINIFIYNVHLLYFNSLLSFVLTIHKNHNSETSVIVNRCLNAYRSSSRVLSDI